jgi:hypothetical protein
VSELREVVVGGTNDVALEEMSESEPELSLSDENVVHAAKTSAETIASTTSFEITGTCLGINVCSYTGRKPNST